MCFPVHGELLNWAKIRCFSGFGTMPGCARSSSLFLHLIVTVVRCTAGRPTFPLPSRCLSNINYASSIAAAVVLPTCGPKSVSSPVCAPFS